MNVETRAAVARATQELAEVMLPPLLERMGREARRLDALARGGSSWMKHAAAELELLDGRSAHLRRSGWSLGVLSAGAGANLLRARRERAGLRLFVAQLTETLGRELTPSVDELPDLGSRRGRGWEVPLLCGWLVLRADRARPGTEPLRWELREGGDPALALWSLEHAPRGVEVRHLAGLVPGTTVGEGPGRWGRLVLPAGWLVLPTA